LKIWLILNKSTFSLYADEPLAVNPINKYLNNPAAGLGIFTQESYSNPPFMLSLSSFFVRLFGGSGERDILLYGKVGHLLAFVVSCVGVYMMGRWLFGVVGGMWGLMMYCCGVLPTVTAAALKEDMLMVGFLSVGLMMGMRYVMRGGFVWLVMSGMLCGFGVGSKYSGLMGLGLVLGMLVEDGEGCGGCGYEWCCGFCGVESECYVGVW
jgi:4-amino-4-deoxy-L-arabinose transferase-like glycosyltransferase